MNFDILMKKDTIKRLPGLNWKGEPATAGQRALVIKGLHHKWNIVATSFTGDRSLWTVGYSSPDRLAMMAEPSAAIKEEVFQIWKKEFKP